jgi:hypothetical protein
MKLQFYRSTSPQDASKKITTLKSNQIDLNNQGIEGMNAAIAHTNALSSGFQFSKKTKGLIKFKKKSSSYVGMH